MNLIEDKWIPITTVSGDNKLIAPWELTDVTDPPVELNCPRPDFQGGLYQFLIGLLQTCFAPQDEEEWLRFWQSPPADLELKDAFEIASTAFELHNPEGPAFLQDFDLPEGEQKSISALLIEAPGGKTLKDNLDHFVKGGKVNNACPSCTASALFTLQTNAPSGGVGHRVGLRGGGPLTTLLIPSKPDANLWQKLWLNVLSKPELSADLKASSVNIFPWLAPTRTSDKKGVTTTPADTHSLQMYWGMPRRIRLSIPQKTEGQCDLCGTRSDSLFSHFITKNYGVNYDGEWVHPLTPYRFDPKKQDLPLSLKGQQGGLGYRHWLGLNFQDQGNGDCAASVTQFFNNERANLLEDAGELNSQSAQLWCFGYDMDNMKARCWYESRMPHLYIDPEFQDEFTQFVSKLITAAKDTLGATRSQIKAAWFSRPKDAKGDLSMIDQAFWQATEPTFYQQLNRLSQLPAATRTMPPSIAKAWHSWLTKTAENQFDQWVMGSGIEDMDMKRVIQSRESLKHQLRKLKSLNLLYKIAQLEETEA
ncbi:MAG: type I-E CRISPR-associated protein Cse1/CasA [Pseudomonadales bacterium]|nr:type I-E CRISPR-associated protein Cse1/CasA [Pseudomonadales bacterium]HAU16288.1 type I-E CRISPR-associated protein Cse1/CasA [Gammaproteobacteria bacterium]HBO93513.1 type I-E CRISPR-associated protein Cse1/CasA [Gammaproteobacteria bacterium]|tara:strand:+ start:1761 stop:3362 length:1602 start_codon:yes stop_codon:yes gene_type:complete